MADAPILGGSKKLQLDDAVFGAPFNGPLVHETVIAELAARRQGTHSTRTRGMVRGGGAKPWRQKGTGRARQGTIRAPQWTGGGVVFGPSPRHYTVKVNRKARKAALRSALSLHAERGSLAVFDASGFDAPSTQQAAGLLREWAAAQPVLVLLDGEESNAGLSFRNIARALAMPVEDAGVADVVAAASLLVSQAALDQITARAIGEAADGAAPEAAAEKPAAKSRTAKQPAAEAEAPAAADEPAADEPEPAPAAEESA
jgi:large subunit ribosomal protein L4